MTQNIELQNRLKTFSTVFIYFVLIVSFSMLFSIIFLPDLLSIICWHTAPVTKISALAYFFTSVAYLLAISQKGKRIKSIIVKILCILLISLGSTVLIIQISGHPVPFLNQIVNKNLSLTQSI